jgi:glucose/arabinose dehydrogenase
MVPMNIALNTVKFRTLSHLCVALSLLVAGCEKSESDGGKVVQSTHYIASKPEGFRFELVNSFLKGPRVLHFHGDRLFVGSKSGLVYWLDPPYHQANILSKLDDYPHSVVVRGNWIYIAQSNGVFRAPYSKETSRIGKNQFEWYFKLPASGGHASRTLKISPENELYVSIGINGNCADQYLDLSYPVEDQRGGIYRIDESGHEPALVPFATGLRNPVGFDWHPGTGTLYASNNGPDHLGFEQPPEYFARLDEGSFHGMPWFQYDGENLVRDDCVKSQPPRPAEEVQLPVALFPARNAPMDVAFVPGDANATELRGDAIVALHGSWGTAGDGGRNGDKSTRRHPKLVVVDFEGDSVKGVRDLVTGFQLADGKRWLRPMGVAIGPDGDIYISSDAALAGLYRLKKL